MPASLQAVANVKQSPDRLKAAKVAAENMGIQFVGGWFTMGEHDLVLIWDAPDDQTMAAIVLAQVMRGNVTTQTMRAFTEDEFAQVVSKLP